MTKQDLIKKLELLPDNAIIVTSGFDHSYRRLGSPSMGEAILDGRDLCEYYKEIPIEDHQTVVPVIVLE